MGAQPDSDGRSVDAERSLERLGGAGLDRFGPVGDLRVIQATAVERAISIAKEFGFSLAEFKADPYLTTLCVSVAVAEQDEFALMSAIRRELAERAEGMGCTYDEALSSATRNGLHDKHYKQFDKIHSRMMERRGELKRLAGARRKPRAADPLRELQPFVNPKQAD